MLIIGKDGKQYDVASVHDLPEEARWDNGEAHHPQTAQAVENATDSSPTRSNANEPSNGSSTNPAPNNAGSNTDPDNGKPENKKKTGTSKPKSDGNKEKKKKFVLSRDDVAEGAYNNRTRKREKAIAGMGRRGSIGTLGFLGAVFDGVSTYNNELSENPNASKAGAAAKGALTAAGWLYTPGLMWSIAGAKGAISLGTEIYEDAHENYEKEKKQSLHITKDASGTAKGTLGGNMIDSETAYTMRQRSEQVMRQHKIATESILGSEARQLHR